MKTGQIFLTACAVCMSIPAIAIEDKSNSFFPKALDLSVPRLSAISLLGLDPSKAGSPTTFNSFVTDYVRGRDLNGILEEGIALAWSFDKLGLGTTINAVDVDSILDGGAESRSARDRIEVARFRNTPMFSLAALKGDPGYTRAAISVSIALIDKSDWRWDVAGNKSLFKQFRLLAQNASQRQTNTEVFTPDMGRDYILNSLDKIRKEPYVNLSLSKQIDKVVNEDPIVWNDLKKLQEDISIAARSEYNDAAAKEAEKWTKEKNDEAVSHRRLVLALAGSVLQKDGDSDAKWDGSYVWLSWEDQIFGGGYTLFAKGFQHDTRYDSTAKSFSTNGGYDIGGKFKSGGKKATSAFFAEGVYSVKQPGKTEITRTIQIGFESKVGDQWLQVGFGPSFKEGKTVTLFGLGLKWNFDTKPALVSGGGTSGGNTLVISAPHI